MPWPLMLWCWLVQACWSKWPIIVYPCSSALISVNISNLHFMSGMLNEFFCCLSVSIGLILDACMSLWHIEENKFKTMTFHHASSIYLLLFLRLWNLMSLAFTVYEGNYIVNYLANRGPELQPFVIGSLVQLLCRLTKFGWFDDDRFRDVAKESINFLNQVFIFLAGFWSTYVCMTRTCFPLFPAVQVYKCITLLP